MKQLFVLAHTQARTRAVQAITEAPAGKTCNKCGQTKPKADFGNHKKEKDGLRKWCKPCCRIQSKKWNAENPDRVATAGKNWTAKNPGRKSELERERKLANPEKYALRAEEYRTENREKCNAAVSKWAVENPEKRRIYRINRRARIYADGGRLSHGLVERLYGSQRGKCACCGEPLGDDYHLDHRMPLALGGANEDSNMQLLRKLCNLQKGAKHPVEFMQIRGALL